VQGALSVNYGGDGGGGVREGGLKGITDRLEVDATMSGDGGVENGIVASQSLDPWQLGRARRGECFLRYQ
jgi:hypothetical protein